MPEVDINEPALREWIGRTQECVDTIDAHHANLMAATLDLDRTFAPGDTLPATWHWAWFTEAEKQSELGRDGHPERDAFFPPVPLPRRMWAANALVYDRHVRVGEKLTRRSMLKDVAAKSGRNGPLCFVTAVHDYLDENDDRCFHETQTLVYRSDPSPDEKPPEPIEPPQGGVLHRTIAPTPTLLFRYSALTFNTHRIHYDRDYCRNVEGYPGLVFHGPLTATLLAAVAQDSISEGALRSIAFQARAPLFDTGPVALVKGDIGTLWAQTPQGGVAMLARYDT